MARGLDAIRAVGPDSWDELAALLADAPGGCWCMWPRLPLGTMSERTAGQNREDARRIVRSGEPAGLLAYRDGKAIGWLALAPRSHFGRLSPAASSTWVIACVYLAPQARGAGVLTGLLAGAIAHARSAGATFLEAIPRGWRTDGGRPAMASLRGALLSAGFEEVDPVALGVLFRRTI
ncbi:MAG TPA: GNAT family N-acetyltransferase [Dehalococcoidia bacterium]|nr:GNAT family N-acetyltransferase [Dehalococcoidia bacterium]